MRKPFEFNHFIICLFTVIDELLNFIFLKEKFEIKNNIIKQVNLKIFKNKNIKWTITKSKIKENS